MSERKLLLADDSVTIQKVVQLTFAEEGIDVSIAGDGDSAMLNFAEFKPDIVLADVNMPGLSGYQVCERIKQNNGDIPVVLLVGSFEHFDEEEAKRVGADGSMTKPFQSIRQLIDTVSSLLSSDRASAEGAPGPTGNAVSDEHNFAETIEMPSYQEMPSYPDGAQLGDSGMDDEMIETTRMDDTGGPEPADEPEPYNGPESYDEPEPYDEPAPASAEARSFENREEVPEHNLERVVDEPEEPAPSYTPAEPDAPEGSDREAPVETPPEISQPLPAPILELDDLNFLEVPMAGVPVLPPVEEEEPGPLEDTPVPTGPSPEFIETVVEKVVEKLSGDSLRDVIREAVREVYAERSGD